MRTIHKFQLQLSGRSVGPMPKGFRVLSVQAQRDWPMLWAEVEDSAPMVQWVFHVVCTGQEIPKSIPSGAYLGTVVLRDGVLVVHVYDGGRA